MILTMNRSIAMLMIGMIILSISSCKKSTYYQLTPEEMEWLVYKNNEILNFKNQNGDVTSYYVTIRMKAYHLENDVYSEFTSANFVQLNDTTAINYNDSRGSHYMFKGAEGFLVTLTWPHFPLKEAPLTGLVPSSATIGGINYYDIFLLDGTGYTDIRFYNQKLWVSQTAGVVQIEDVSGNLWVREF